MFCKVQRWVRFMNYLVRQGVELQVPKGAWPSPASLEWIPKKKTNKSSRWSMYKSKETFLGHHKFVTRKRYIFILCKPSPDTSRLIIKHQLETVLPFFILPFSSWLLPCRMDDSIKHRDRHVSHPSGTGCYLLEKAHRHDEPRWVEGA